jgi:hypothetical protein
MRYLIRSIENLSQTDCQGSVFCVHPYLGGPWANSLKHFERPCRCSACYAITCYKPLPRKVKTSTAPRCRLCLRLPQLPIRRAVMYPVWAPMDCEPSRDSAAGAPAFVTRGHSAPHVIEQQRIDPNGRRARFSVGQLELCLCERAHEERSRGERDSLCERRSGIRARDSRKHRRRRFGSLQCVAESSRRTRSGNVDGHTQCERPLGKLHFDGIAAVRQYAIIIDD